MTNEHTTAKRVREVSILRLGASYSVATDYDGPYLCETITGALEAARAILEEDDDE